MLRTADGNDVAAPPHASRPPREQHDIGTCISQCFSEEKRQWCGQQPWVGSGADKRRPTRYGVSKKWSSSTVGAKLISASATVVRALIFLSVVRWLLIFSADKTPRLDRAGVNGSVNWPFCRIRRSSKPDEGEVWYWTGDRGRYANQRLALPRTRDRIGGVGLGCWIMAHRRGRDWLDGLDPGIEDGVIFALDEPSRQVRVLKRSDCFGQSKKGRRVTRWCQRLAV